MRLCGSMIYGLFGTSMALSFLSDGVSFYTARRARLLLESFLLSSIPLTTIASYVILYWHKTMSRRKCFSAGDLKWYKAILKGMKWYVWTHVFMNDSAELIHCGFFFKKKLWPFRVKSILLNLFFSFLLSDEIPFTLFVFFSFFWWSIE